MSTHNIGIFEEISKIIPQLSSNTHLISSSEVFYLITRRISINTEEAQPLKLETVVNFTRLH